MIALFLSAFVLGSLPHDANNSVVSKADNEWTNLIAKALPTKAFANFDGSDGFIYFNMNPNDYSAMPDDYLIVTSATYYNASDYNFLTHIQLSNDNETYISFSTIYNTTKADYFFKDGTFRLGIRHNAATIKDDASYQYIKVLEGCEFPSYSYCVNGGAKKKYVQKETTISKLTSYDEKSTYGTAYYKNKVNFTGIAYGWNNADYGMIGYRQLILSYGEQLFTDDNVPIFSDYLNYTETADATNRATSTYDIGKKLTINSLSIYKIASKETSTKVGYDHGHQYLYVNYPADLLYMNNNNMVPTIHIEEETEFLDVLLPELTLKLMGDSWIVSDSDDFTVTDPLDLDINPLVTYPYRFDGDSHAIKGLLPSEGCKLAFNINTGNIDLTNPLNVFNIDGLYNCLISIYVSTGAVLLFDKDAVETPVQEYYGLMFAPNTTYRFEIEISCGEQTTVKMAINHLLVVNHTFNKNKSMTCDLWMIDTSGQFTMDYYEDLEAYRPIIVYGGSSTYDFLEGDPVYNFANVVNAFDLYDDSVTKSSVQYLYEDGAVTDGKYNAGTWTLTILLDIDGYEQTSKLITINVHGKTSMAKIYYDDVGPIEAPIGSKLVPPDNPSTYRQGDHDYVFDGWYFEGAKWDFENDVVQGDMHLYSRFVAIDPHYVVTVKYEGIEKEDSKYSLTNGSSLPFSLFELEGATFEVFMGNNKITSLVVQDDVTIVVKYKILFTYVEAKEATCTSDGNVGYWYSPIYAGYYFADPDGRELLHDVFTPRLNHHIVHLDYEDSSCHELGHVACYYCENCHKHFVDENAENELIEWSIAKKPHVLTHFYGVSATCETDGIKEHWVCANEPGVYYGDEDCSIVLDTLVIDALAHDYRAPKYRWKENNGTYECKATIKCSHCHDEISETKQATKVFVRASTCSREGQIAYSVKFENSKFNSQTKVVAIEKTPHTYVRVSQIDATKDTLGVKEHFECSECHKCFIKNGDTYQEVEYSELFFSGASKRGCKGDITSSSLLVLVSAGALSILLFLKRKEER